MLSKKNKQTTNTILRGDYKTDVSTMYTWLLLLSIIIASLSVSIFCLLFVFKSMFGTIQ